MVTIRRESALALLAGLVLFCGCAHQYIINLKNGDRVVAISKPKLEGALYHFRDARGEEQVVAQKYVLKIKAGYIVKQKQEPSFPGPSSQAKSIKPVKPESLKAIHKPKHWYFLWLK